MRGMSDAELSAKAARVVGRPFPKGVSGCPGGRPRQDVTALARAHTVDAIEALVAALKRPKEAVPAAVALLDRGWGRPVQAIAADPEHPPLQQLHLLAAQVISSELVLEIASQPSPATAQPSKVVDLALISPPTE